MTAVWISEVILVLSVLFGDVISVKNVLLTIEPRVVQKGTSSTLRCSFDLQDESLYSVKWYRGRHEFYRFTPSEQPNSKKIFKFKGINVDREASNSTQVVLRDIDFNLSGNFMCEVTTDATHLTTGADTKAMLVVELPEYPPTISVTGEPLDYGDILRANCSCSPSRPKTSLTFFLNNYTVAHTEPLSPHQYQESAWSDLSLEIRLYEEHFNDGRLILRCVADIEEIYHVEAVLKLGSVRDPVPERVSAYNRSVSTASLQLLFLNMFVFVNILLVLS
ncbi:uncharacterized protein LOC126890525 [Diabrotica virgifera virgifera]|uniref:Ig-like domain-containing protein n=1 Tax=Diabrotica virgifera virgifera TaxID=50390 RepID=A0ABM5KZ75_DIAVI|nr:uncharacterized protein LOC126890525 [Diabrotica virgifera virgifera]